MKINSISDSTHPLFEREEEFSSLPHSLEEEQTNEIEKQDKNLLPSPLEAMRSDLSRVEDREEKEGLLDLLSRLEKVYAQISFHMNQNQTKKLRSEENKAKELTNSSTNVYHKLAKVSFWEGVLSVATGLTGEASAEKTAAKVSEWFKNSYQADLTKFNQNFTIVSTKLQQHFDNKSQIQNAKNNVTQTVQSGYQALRLPG